MMRRETERAGKIWEGKSWKGKTKREGRKTGLCLALLLCLVLTGCGNRLPERDLLGNPWQESWIMVGTGLGAEEPGDLTLLENKDVLAADGLYYASWIRGEKKPHVNEEGEEADLYPLQLYVLAAECQKEEEATEHRENWLAGARVSYQVEEEREERAAGVDFTLLIYEAPETSPYARGVSAFGSAGTRAFCMELMATEGEEGDLKEELSSFLAGCHVAAK